MDAKTQRSALRNAVLFSAVPQFIVFECGAFMTIFGNANYLLCATFASTVTIALTLFVGLRREGFATNRDLRIIKWSYFPVLVLTSALWDAWKGFFGGGVGDAVQILG